MTTFFWRRQPPKVRPRANIRREMEHDPSKLKVQAATEEVARRKTEGYPGDTSTVEETMEAIERWLDPETVDRSLVRTALWEQQRHWWQEGACVCGYSADFTKPTFEAMRDHKEDVLAQMLGLTIRPRP